MKISRAHTGVPHPNDGNKGNTHFLGKHHTLETKGKLSRSHTGTLNGNYGKPSTMGMLGKHHTPETKAKIGLARKGHPPSRGMSGKHHSSETLTKMSVLGRQRFANPDYVARVLKGLNSQTKPERHIEILLQALYPNEFRYNGAYECEVGVDGLIPDFVNVNGKKQVIDVHGSYWHEGEDVTERQTRYAKYGYASLIIWDYELKDEKAVIQRITEFMATDPHHYFEEVSTNDIKQ